ncbi:zinc-dependent alcohol dehydrogenase family protein [Sphingomonas profundi]|uniref:zinc-dependent alcohol dehydrogenase family protein n=1 Tax=Alterirhizorhabdus profundi TaxID=2681549 RepID=UPI0012E8CDE1|nr:NAD(P)-dependent alcohol dehydrogenase [Sphingomonas profundi]
MKRYELAAPATLETLAFVERDPPRPASGEVLVRVRATSLNFHDYLVVTGILPAAPGRVPMSDGAGEVVEVGADVTAFRVGDRVIGTFFPDWPDGRPSAAHASRMRGDQVDGFASEYVALPERDFTAAPAGLSDAEAATLPCAALTAWRALVVEGGIRPGDRVLVQGSGGVSIFAVQFAKLAGATVIATTSSEAKAERLKAIGADHVLNYNETPKWGAAARRISDGGVDHVVEVVGGDLAQSLTALRVGGRLSLVGALSRQPIQFAAMYAIGANARITGLTVGSRQHQRDMVRAIEVAGLKPVIDSRFPLADLAGAFRHQAAQAHFGKICVTL